MPTRKSLKGHYRSVELLHYKKLIGRIEIMWSRMQDTRIKRLKKDEIAYVVMRVKRVE